MDSVLWLVVFIALAVIEGLTVGIFAIWFAIGAIGGLVAAQLGATMTTQILVVAFVSLLCTVTLRPITKKYLQKRVQPTNADRVIGQMAVVTSEINNVTAQGSAIVFGQEWTARSVKNDIIPVGKEVKVARIEGVKIFVEEVVKEL
jgi:Membrane protein implicated in regulation of membrane protease activity